MSIYSNHPIPRSFWDRSLSLYFGVIEKEEFHKLFLAIIVWVVVAVFWNAWLFFPMAVYIVAKIFYFGKYKERPWHFVIRRARRTYQRVYPVERSAYASAPILSEWGVPASEKMKRVPLLKRIRFWLSPESLSGPQESKRYAPSLQHRRWTEKKLGIWTHFPIAPLDPLLPKGRDLALFMRNISRQENIFGKVLRSIWIDDPRESVRDYLPWATKPDDATVRLRTGGYLRTWEVTCQDTLGMTSDTIGETIKSTMHTMMLNLPPGYCVQYSNFCRNKPVVVEQDTYGTEAGALIELERKNELEKLKQSQENIYIHLSFHPEIVKKKDLTKIDDQEEFQENNTVIDTVTLEEYQLFIGVCSLAEMRLQSGGFQSVRLLKRDEHGVDRQETSYAHLLTLDDRILIPSTSARASVSEVLGFKSIGVSEPFLTSGNILFTPVEIFGYPKNSNPDLLRHVKQYADIAIISGRWIYHEDDETIKGIREVAKRTNQRSTIKIGEEEIYDSKSGQESREVIRADALHRSDIEHIGHASFTLVLGTPIDGDLPAARQRLAEQRSILIGSLSTMKFLIDDGYHNHFQAFMGTMPGNIRTNVVRSPLSSVDFVNFCTTTQAWQGNKTLVDPENFYETNDGTPPPPLARFATDDGFFDYSPQYDTTGGHGILTGTTGLGKSTFIAGLAQQHAKYNAICKRGSRQILFDRDGSLLPLAITHHARILSYGRDGEGFAPFQDVDTADGKEVAMHILRAMFRGRKIEIDNHAETQIKTIIQELEEIPDREERTLTAATQTSIEPIFRDALIDYTDNGTLGCGRMFMGTKAMQTGPGMIYIDTGSIFPKSGTEGEDNPVYLPALLCIVNAISQAALEAIPTFMIAEEFWELLTNKQTVEIFDGWLKRLRKFGFWVWLVTHSYEDFKKLGPDGEARIKQLIASTIVLPTVFTQEERDGLERLGIPQWESFALSEKVRRAPIVNGHPEQYAFILQNRTGRRAIVKRTAPPIFRSICGATSQEARKKFRATLERYPVLHEALEHWVQEQVEPTGEEAAMILRDYIHPLYAKARQKNGTEEPVYPASMIQTGV